MIEVREADRGYYQSYVGKKCTIEMCHWNDGICDAYVIGQDKDFVFYFAPEKKCNKVGALAKKYMQRITREGESEVLPQDMDLYMNPSRYFFRNRLVNVYLNERYFFSGIFGKETEILGAFLGEMNDECITILPGQQIELGEIAKIETRV